MSNSSTGGGIGFLGLLTLLFIALKLMGEITWPWIWILAPIWGVAALVLMILGVIFAVVVIIHFLKAAFGID